MASGPFNVPQSAESKNILGFVLHEVRMLVPDFLVIMGPLIIEREGQKFEEL